MLSKGMEAWAKALAVALLVLAMVVSVAVSLGACRRPEYQQMSVAGYGIRIEDGDGTEIFAVDDDGNVTIGDGTPGETQNGEDFYCEGQSEFDGAAYFDGAVDMDSTLAVADDITLENGEKVSNSTDGVIELGGFVALDEGTRQTLATAETLTATASFQPITTTGATTDITLADGSYAGQILVISNESANDVTLDESDSNGHWGGDITLTGDAYDLLTLLWDGARWVKLSFFDN